MRSIFVLFWRLTTFRLGPAEVPAAPALLPVLCIAFLAVNMGVRMALFMYGLGAALASSAVILGVWAVMIYALLAFKNVRERFLQTFVALLGVDCVLTLLNVLPGGLSLFVTVDDPLEDILRLLVIVLFVWDMLAKGAIYREALNVGPMQANLLAMCFPFGFTYLDVAMFSPEPSH